MWRKYLRIIIPQWL